MYAIFDSIHKVPNSVFVTDRDFLGFKKCLSWDYTITFPKSKEKNKKTLDFFYFYNKIVMSKVKLNINNLGGQNFENNIRCGS